MSLKGKTALVLGATGTIGYGAAYDLLKEGARVAVVARTQQKLDKLLDEFKEFTNNVVGVTGSFESKKSVESFYTEVKHALNGPPDHVVSSLGFVDMTEAGILSSDVSVVKHSIDEYLYPSIVAAQVIVSDIKDNEGATYTVMNGGFCHACVFPGCWAATIKNAAINSMFMCLVTDTAKNNVRVNCSCLHFSVNKPGEKTNKLNMPAEMDSVEYGRVFLAIINKKDLKGQSVCERNKEEFLNFVSTTA